MQNVCAICGKPANHKFVKIINGQMEERYLCDKHAAETQTYLAKSNIQMTFEELLAKLFQQASQQQETPETTPPEQDVCCSACGLPFSAYRKTMILGCDRCYESFEELLQNDLRKFHGATRHIGRAPANFRPYEDKKRPVPAQGALESEAAAPAAQKPHTPINSYKNVARLRKDMQKAVEEEDFEKAARLRDQIRKIESQSKE